MQCSLAAQSKKNVYSLCAKISTSRDPLNIASPERAQIDVPIGSEIDPIMASREYSHSQKAKSRQRHQVIVNPEQAR